MTGVISNTFSSEAVALFASAARTADTTGDIFGVSRFSAAIIHLDVTAASGTSPTLDLYIQQRIPDGNRPSSTWHDLIHFTQMTTTGGRVAYFVSAGNSEVVEENVTSSSTLAAGTIRTAVIGTHWRAQAEIAGTNPSFTFSVYADFFE